MEFLRGMSHYDLSFLICCDKIGRVWIQIVFMDEVSSDIDAVCGKF